MEHVFGVILILAGMLGASALIVAKMPNAARIVEGLVPLQALIGVVAIIMAFVMVGKIGPKAIFEAAKYFPLMGASMVVGVLAGILLGFMYIVPLLAGLGGGQQRAQQLAQQIAPWQMMLGLVAMVAGLLIILFRAGILPPTFPSGMGI